MCESPHWDPDSAGDSCPLRSPHHLIRELCSLFRDDTAVKMIHRHVFLIYEYLQTSKQGFYLEDLRYLTLALEHLVEHVDEQVEYVTPLRQLLEACRLPLMLQKTSSVLHHARDFQEYFTLLGYLIVTLPDDDLQLVVMEIIQCLLTRCLNPGVANVKLHDRQHAMERSRLPTTLAELIEIASPAIFPHILNVTLLIVNASDEACRKMIEAGALDGIFLRMDPEYFSRDLSRPLPDSFDLDSVEMTRDHETDLSTSSSVLWALLGSLKDTEACRVCACRGNPSQLALGCVRFVFRYYVMRSGNAANRNDLLCLIVLAVSVLPDLFIVQSGLAEDIMLLSVASEVGVDNTWAAGLQLGPTEEDVEFKKMLLLALCHFVRIPAAIQLLRRHNVMSGVLDLMNPPDDQHIPWSPTQALDLVAYALRTLSFLVPVLRQEFVNCQGPHRLLQMITWYGAEPYDLDIRHNCLRTLSVVLSSEDGQLLDAFRQQQALTTLFGFCSGLLAEPVLTTASQRILTHAVFALERLLRDHAPSQRDGGQQVIDLVVAVCRRVIVTRPEDTRTDQRLLIAVVDLLWEAVVWNPENVRLFVRQGGVYVLLDTMQKSIFCGKAIFLSALVDLVEQGDCVPHLVTWRDPGSGEGYQPVLAQLWREEEARKRVRRTPLGAIDDIELSLMGEDQWHYTYTERMRPSIADMFGSLRPKIYSITQILKQRHADRVNKARKYYNTDSRPLSTQDQVTYALASNYLALKLGEIWRSVSMDLEAMGVNPIGVDGDLIGVMRQRVLQWVAHIQTTQRAILVADKMKKQTSEVEFYAEQHENHLAPTLDAMHELDFIACTTDRGFLLANKQQEARQVDESLSWPDESHCRHRTYTHNTHVSMTGGQDMTVISVGKEVGMEQDLRLIETTSESDCRAFRSNESIFLPQDSA